MRFNRIDFVVIPSYIELPWFAWTQKACLRFLKPCFKLKILILFFFVVSLLVDYVQLKKSFSDEKNISGLSKINVGKYWRWIPLLVKVGALQSCS